MTHNHQKKSVAESKESLGELSEIQKTSPEQKGWCFNVYFLDDYNAQIQ